jgi:uncharacterized protein YjbI with pentapeptide repeats
LVALAESALNNAEWTAQQRNGVMMLDIMANKKHLATLAKGVHEWNSWRDQHQEVLPDLTDARLVKADLKGIDLQDALMHRVRLEFANLENANLREAHLQGADLRSTTLLGANLENARLHLALLQRADMSRTNLFGATLDGADLRDTKLLGANLERTRLVGVRLASADVAGARIGGTMFGVVDLRGVRGLDTVVHTGPSTIGIDTIYASKGQIPEPFLRNAGVPDGFVAFMKSLAGTAFAFQSCFISYSCADQLFAERLYSDLRAEGVRCWYAPEDLKVGDELRNRIDESIQLHDKLLIVLSGSSIKSWWVKKEVETAFDREAKDKRAVLFPIRVDEEVMKTEEAWAADIRRARHIGDFTGWEIPSRYSKALERLLVALKSEPR